jgi:hypothetical protein
MQNKPKHKTASGDFIIVFAVILGFLLTGGFVFRTSNYPSQQSDQTIVITKPVPLSKSSLQLNTFDVKRCSSTTAIDFLIDNSGSMQFGTKMQELQNALKIFAGKFPTSGAIALQTYSETVQDKVHFSLFKDSKNQFLNAVSAMTPQTATHSKDAFLVAQNSLKQGMKDFPNYKFSLVFISDGIPETDAANKACIGGQNSQYCAPHPFDSAACRCYDVNQDPTSVASQIKASGVRIYTIAFVDSSESKFNADLQTMMADVASSPSDYYMAPIDTQLTDIITQISTSICTE